MNFATTSEKVTKYFAPKQKFNDRKTQTAEANMIKHDLLSYLVISHIRSRTFSTGNIDSKAFVVPVDRVFNLQRKERYSRHS